MFVSKLYTDNWTGNRNEENFIENPIWQQIKMAICNLDGNTKTLVSLEADNESYMIIGGGNAGKYIVTVTLDNETFYSLLRPVSYQIAKSVTYAKKNHLLNFYQALINAKNNNVSFSNDGQKRIKVISKPNAYAKKIHLLTVKQKLNNTTNTDNVSSFNDEQKLIVGGQSGNYPAKICVNLPQCLIAAITFAESGKLEPLFTWEEDESLVIA
jgi:hypothetical protein